MSEIRLIMQEIWPSNLLFYFKNYPTKLSKLLFNTPQFDLLFYTPILPE